MNWITVALVMTVFMGGIIAYNGDIIGRKFGKRRVSLLGLRPRHTAVLITSLTGVAISALTTIVLFLIVSPVRDVLLRGEQALAQNRRLTVANRGLAADIRMRQDELARVQQDLADGKLTEQQLNRQIRALDDRTRALQRSVRSEQAKAAAAERRVADARAQVQKATETAETQRRAAAELETANERVRANNSRLLKRQAELVLSAAKLEEANKQRTQQNADLQAENESISRQNETLTRENTTLTGARDALRAESDRLAASQRDLAAETARLTDQNRTLTEANDRLLRTVRQLAPEYNSMAEAYLAMRSRRVIVHAGEDLARVEVPANATAEQVRTALAKLTRDAGSVARSRGAGSDPDGNAVRIADKQFYANAQTGAGPVVVPVEVSGELRTNAVVERLSRQDTPYCVLALAVSNSVDREPAIIDYQPLPNPLIYAEGGVVGTREFQGMSAPERIFAEIVEFVKALGQEALHRGSIPRIDPVTGEPQVGALVAGDIVKLTERVRGAGRSARVTARATRDTNASEQLDLEFKVEPAR